MATEQKQTTVFNKTVLLIGGRGTIGGKILEAFGRLRLYGYDSVKLDVTIAGSSDQGKEVTVNDNKYPYIQVNLSNTESIKSALSSNKYDWVIACGGNAPLGPIGSQTIDAFKEACNSKGFGQIDLVVQANKLMNDNGCIVLTSGYLDRYPVKGTSGIATVNGMINGFVKAAGLETNRGIKVNSVSPGLLTESAEAFGPFLPDQPSVDGKDVALAYVRALISGKTGCVFEIISPKQWSENS